MRIKHLFVSTAVLFLLLSSWTYLMAVDATMYKSISDVPPVKWHELSKKKIYFGHQSVGFNIVEGMRRIMVNHPEIQLNIVETRTAKGADGAFMHSRVGENRKPNTKINDFVHVIDHELGGTPDAAALKFCFVDAHDKIDEQKVFQEYKEAMEVLKKEHPDLTIIHFTMPLRTQPMTWKTRVKLLLGKEPWELADNIKRNQFNKFLLQEYQGKEPVFDIAGYEGTSSSGEKSTFTYKGESYLTMLPEYSSDGGHLNAKGEHWVAEHFLLFLVQSLTN